jgi:hypothetical protein
VPQPLFLRFSVVDTKRNVFVPWQYYTRVTSFIFGVYPEISVRTAAAGGTIDASKTAIVLLVELL